MGHRKYDNPQKGTTGFVKDKVVYRSISQRGVERLQKSITETGRPKFGNKRSKTTGKPVGENFYAESEEYARKFAVKGKRNTGQSVTLRVQLHHDIDRRLFRNPQQSRLHTSMQGEPGFEGLKTARSGERSGVIVKRERLKKTGMKSSINYGLRESEDSSSPHDAYKIFNESIRRIDILPDVERGVKPQTVYRRPTGIVVRRRPARARRQAPPPTIEMEPSSVLHVADPTRVSSLLATGTAVFNEALKGGEPWAKALSEWDGTFDPWKKDE